MPLPCLPKDDPNPEPRSLQLQKSRQIYRYAYEWPPGVAVAAEVPKGDDYSPEYIAKILGITADIFKNLLPVADLFASPEQVHDFLAGHLARMKSLGFHDLRARFFQVQTEVAHAMTAEKPASLEAYGRFYNSIEAPPAWRGWDDDRSFAWQRLAGVNPMVIRRIEAIPEHVAIGEREFERAVGRGTLAAALAQGRVFACDYGLLAGVPTGTTNGRRKWLPAPYALFAAFDGQLTPVAIQTDATRASPVYGPRDGYAWRIARLAAQAADASVHEVVSHLGRTHMVMEAAALATHRQLAENHPLAVLLAPHFEFTLPINNSAATNLIAPGGAIDLIFGGTIEATAGLVKKGLEAFSLPDSAITSDLAARGLDDPTILPELPYRDDGVLVWQAIRKFVRAYVGRYYPSDAAVAQDPELAAWIHELGSSEGGRLGGLRPIATVAALAELVAVLVWTGSAQHAAVNFPQYPYMSPAPNVIGAFWAEWPVAGAESTAATQLSVMPPYNMAALQHATVYQLSSLRMNRLGDYPVFQFRDREVRELVDAFNADLASAEKVIAARDRNRFMPYPFLLPSTIPASIHI